MTGLGFWPLSRTVADCHTKTDIRTRAPTCARAPTRPRTHAVPTVATVCDSNPPHDLQTGLATAWPPAADHHESESVQALDRLLDQASARTAQPTGHGEQRRLWGAA